MITGLQLVVTSFPFAFLMVEINYAVSSLRYNLLLQFFCSYTLCSVPQILIQVGAFYFHMVDISDLN